MTNAGSQPSEIWLRGNVRPVAWLAVVVAVVGAGLVAATTMAASTTLQRLVVAACCGLAAAMVGLLARAAARPRLEHVGGRLRIRLSPTAVHEVPLSAVECFFQGSNPIASNGEPTCGERASFRVNTLVLRLAERAAECSSRATFTPWGTWDDGYVVFDGRWCEPLSAELARHLGRRLIDAKRSAAGATPAAVPGPAAAEGVP